MTWILNPLGSVYDRYSPEPDMQEWFDYHVGRYEALSEREKEAKFGYYERGYIKEIARKLEYGGGDLEPDDWPKVIRLKRKYKKLADFFHVWGFFMVSERMRDLLEEFDAGVHTFKDIPFDYDTDEKFYAFHTPTNLQAVDIEASDPDHVRWSKDHGKYDCNPGEHGSAGVAFDSSKINGRGFWRDTSLVIPSYCISDDFKKAMKQGGMSFPRNFKTKVTL